MSDEALEVEEEIEQDNDEVLEGDEPEEKEEVEQDDGLTLSFDEDAEEDELPEEAPKWAKELRVRNREQAKENRELKRKIKDGEQAADASQEALILGDKPKLEDFQYDADQYDTAMDGWRDKKSKLDKQTSDRKADEDAQAKHWDDRLANYKSQQVEIDNFDEAEDFIKDTLSVTQQGIIIMGSENSAKLISVLGKNTKVSEKLAAITDPIKFAMAIGRMETQMSKGKKPPSPEKRINGSGPAPGSKDSTLDRLRTEADKTGDLSPVIAHKRKIKAAREAAQ